MSEAKNGLVSLESRHSFDETWSRLLSEVIAKGLSIFASIDFSKDAENAGLKMNPTRLLVFGNPRAGTPVMVASPSIAIDLPLEILVSEDENGKVSVSYNAVEFMRDRHNVPDNLLKNISGIASIAESIVHI